ncbi:MAG: hypothetical protein ACOX6T_27810 [Myxococcales bacterium]|jgi:hypothetical protein
MPENVTYNTTVSSRTALAEHLLEAPELLAIFESVGGRREDLEAVAQAGKRAALLSMARVEATSQRKTAVSKLKTALADVRREHKALLAVLRMVVHDLERGGASQTLIAQARGVLEDQRARRVRAQPDDSGARTYKAYSREVVRIEIEKDAMALLTLVELHAPLSRRGVTVARLEAFRQAVGALGSHFALRTECEGKKLSSMAAERCAVKEQKHPLCQRA